MKNCWFNRSTVILTGASGGIGKEMVLLLINKYNCRVIGIGRSEEKMLSIIDELGSKADSFEYFLFDTSVRSNWSAFAEHLGRDKIQPDILINNAGILPSFCKFSPESPCGDSGQIAVNTMEVNFYSSVYSISELMPLLAQSKRPAIVNISSSDALAPLPGTASYSASKAALKCFTESFMVEQAGSMYVGLICPGFSKTDIFRQQRHSSQNKAIDLISMNPDKMAQKILNAVVRKRRKAIIGADAKAMNFFYRLLGINALKLFGFVMKASKIELFDDIFCDTYRQKTTEKGR